MATTTHTDSVYMTSSGIAWEGGGVLSRVIVGTAETADFDITIRDGLTNSDPIIAKIAMDPVTGAGEAIATKGFELAATFKTGIYAEFHIGKAGWITLVID